MIHWPILGPVGQDRVRADLSLLRAVFRCGVAVPSRCFRAWFGCSCRDGWCHLRCSKACEMSTWASGCYRAPVGDTCPSGAADRVFWCISNGSEYLLRRYSGELLLCLYHLTLMEQLWHSCLRKTEECLEGSEECCVPGKFSIYGGNLLHLSEHLQLLSFEPNRQEEINMDKTVASVPKIKPLPCFSGLNVLQWRALDVPLWPMGSGGKGCCGILADLQGRVFLNSSCPLPLLWKGTSTKSWCSTENEIKYCENFERVFFVWVVFFFLISFATFLKFVCKVVAWESLPGRRDAGLGTGQKSRDRGTGMSAGTNLSLVCFALPAKKNPALRPEASELFASKWSDGSSWNEMVWTSLWFPAQVFESCPWSWQLKHGSLSL